MIVNPDDYKSPYPDSDHRHWHLRILYTNWKGVKRWRRIVPDKLMLSSTQHPDKTCLRAFDLDKNEYRSFVMENIHQIIQGDGPIPPEDV